VPGVRFFGCIAILDVLAEELWPVHAIPIAMMAALVRDS
jgi:hypothetical protein